MKNRNFHHNCGTKKIDFGRKIICDVPPRQIDTFNSCRSYNTHPLLYGKKVAFNLKILLSRFDTVHLHCEMVTIYVPPPVRKCINWFVVVVSETLPRTPGEVVGGCLRPHALASGWSLLTSIAIVSGPQLDPNEVADAAGFHLKIRVVKNFGWKNTHPSSSLSDPHVSLSHTRGFQRMLGSGFNKKVSNRKFRVTVFDFGVFGMVLRAGVRHSPLEREEGVFEQLTQISWEWGKF